MRNAMFAIALATSAAISATETNLNTTTIQVQGMSCGSCAAAVTHVLKQVEGVREVHVSYEKGEAVVSYDPAQITPAAIAHSAEQKLPGYKFASQTASAPHASTGTGNTLPAATISSAISPTQIDPEHVSFYEVGLVCEAAPKIGCGGRSKPVLLGLTNDSHVAGAWLNEAGTRLAIGWKTSKVLSPEQVDQIVSSSGVTVNEVSHEARPELVASFRSERGWFDAASVDRLSEQEAGIIAARLVKRLTDRTSVTSAQQAMLRERMAQALRANFIEGDRRDLDEQLVGAAKGARLGRQAVGSLREVVALGIYPLPNEK
jgi:copper chaperone CopZ